MVLTALRVTIEFFQKVWICLPSTCLSLLKFYFLDTYIHSHMHIHQLISHYNLHPSEEPRL